MIPFSNWVILIFLHFAFIFLIQLDKRRPILVSISSSLILVYFCFIGYYLFIFYSDLRFLSEQLILSSANVVFLILVIKNLSLLGNYSLDFFKVFISIVSALLFYLFVSQLYDPQGLKFTDFYIINNGYIYAFLFLCLLPAVFEELFFRVVIFNKLSGVYTKINTVGISAVFFGLMHFVFHPLTSFGYLFIMGVILGIIRIKFENIYYCIIFHFVYNFLSIAL
jgi:uncharacterized protein